MIFSPNRPETEQQEAERDHVGEPALDAAAEHVELAENSPTPMMMPPTMAPEIEVKPPRMSTGRAFVAMICRANDTSENRAPHDPGRQRHDAGGEPHDDPDLLQRDADRQRRLVAVGDRPQRPADPRALEEDREPRHHDRRDDGRRDDDLLQRTKPPSVLQFDRAPGR